MKIIDGTNLVMGRVASYAAKESLKGEEVRIINCEKLIITGGKKNIKKELEEKRGRVGSTQKGQKVSRDSEKILKRVIRGMIPSYRTGRGKAVFGRIKCYKGVPKELENEKISSDSLKLGNKLKGVRIGDIK